MLPIWQRTCVRASLLTVWLVPAAQCRGTSEPSITANRPSGALGLEFVAHTITTSADNVEEVFAVDLDGDADMDVLTEAKTSRPMSSLTR